MTAQQKMSERPSVSMDLLDEIHEAFSSRGGDTIAQYFAGDAVFYMASGPEPEGRAGPGKGGDPQGPR